MDTKYHLPLLVCAQSEGVVIWVTLDARYLSRLLQQFIKQQQLRQKWEQARTQHLQAGEERRALELLQQLL